MLMHAFVNPTTDSFSIASVADVVIAGISALGRGVDTLWHEGGSCVTIFDSEMQIWQRELSKILQSGC